MADSSAKDGHATEAMNALIKNEPMRKNIVDNICIGEDAPQKSDLIEAIRIGCNYWMTDPTVKQIGFLEAMRNYVKAQHDANMSNIDSKSLKFLRAFFRDLCTATETMQDSATKNVDQELVDQLLHGREVQNHPSKYQETHKALFGGIGG